MTFTQFFRGSKPDHFVLGGQEFPRVQIRYPFCYSALMADSLPIDQLVEVQEPPKALFPADHPPRRLMG